MRWYGEGEWSERVVRGVVRWYGEGGEQSDMRDVLGVSTKECLVYFCPTF